MLQIHPNARTTPVTRAEIAGSHERTGLLAQRYGVSTETIRKWRKRGVAQGKRMNGHLCYRSDLVVHPVSRSNLSLSRALMTAERLSGGRS
jgi:transposase-like protein